MASKQLKKEDLAFKVTKALIAYGIIIGLFACGHSHNKTESETTSYPNVSVIHPIQQDFSIYKEFQGTTQFTQHLQIKAQSTGIIVKSFIAIGNKVKTGQPLFVIKSREATLLSSIVEGEKLSQMADTIVSFSSGIIDQILVQQGDFVQQGDILATSVSKEFMRIVVSVPLEENTIKYQNKPCLILLPDGVKIKGKVGTSLPVANNNDQTNQILVYPETGDELPENVHVRVKIKERDIKNGIFIPNNAVYSNEELTKLWVFKVVHDSIALKTPVKAGVQTDSLVQLIFSNLNLSDTLILNGGYGLPDSARVNIIHRSQYEKE